MQKILTEDLMNQIRLMNYDRSKTVYEQITTPDKRRISQSVPKVTFDLSPLTETTPAEIEAYKIFKALEPEIEAYFWFDEDFVEKTVMKINRENYIPLLLHVIGKGNPSVMSWLMTQFDKVNSQSAQRTRYPSHDEVIDYYTNDKYVLNISKHLTQFKDLNTEEGKLEIAKWNETSSVRMITNTAHIVLPIASFILTLGAANLVYAAVAAGLELIDAAIYLLVDKDPYAAGLATIFAFAGPADNLLKPLVIKYGKSILQKLSKKLPLTVQESAVIKYVSANKSRLLAKTYLRIASTVLRALLLKPMTLKKCVKFIYWLVKKGYLTVNFVTHFGIVVGGSFVTWDKIASLYGICNSMPLKDLTQSKYKILKLIGESGSYLQPYTKGCHTDVGEKVFNKIDKTLENRRISNNLEALITNNLVLSTKYSKVKMVETLAVQEALNHFGYGRKTKESDDYKYVVSGKKKTKDECLRMDPMEMFKYPECMSKEYDIFKTTNATDNELKKFEGVGINRNYKSPDYGGDIKKILANSSKINWGFYDEQTEAMVAIFQKDNNLEVTGEANNEVVELLKSRVDELTKKEEEIPNYSKFEWSPEEIEKIRKQTLKLLRKEMANKGEPMITKEEAEKAYNDQKMKVATDVENEFNKVSPNMTPEKTKEIENAIKDLENQ